MRDRLYTIKKGAFHNPSIFETIANEMVWLAIDDHEKRKESNKTRLFDYRIRGAVQIMFSEILFSHQLKTAK